MPPAPAADGQSQLALAAGDRAVARDAQEDGFETPEGGGGLMKSAYQIIRRPVITEKAERAKEFDPKAAKDKTSRKKEATSGQLVFEVAAKATKTEIKQAVQQVFKVKVDKVQTANFHGKERRRGRFAGHRPDWKKAYVRLKVGEKMPEYADNA